MKLLFTFICACALGFSLPAQVVYNYLQHSFSSKGGQLTVSTSGDVILTGLQTNYLEHPNGAIQQFHFDSTNRPYLDYSLPGLSNEYPKDFNAMTLTDGRMVIVGNIQPCDYWQPYRMAMYDQHGILLWDKYMFDTDDISWWDLYTLDVSFDEFALALDGSSGDSVITFSGVGWQTKISLDGKAISTDSVGQTGYIKDQLHLNNGFVVNRANTLQTLDASFAVLSERNFATDIIAFDTTHSGGVVVLADSIYLLDEAMQVIATGNLPPDLVYVSSAHDKLALASERGRIAIYDLSLSLLDTTTLPFPNIVSDVLYANDLLHIAGTYDVQYDEYGYGEQSIFHIGVPLDEPISFELPDVSIDGVDLPDGVTIGPAKTGPYCKELDFGNAYVTLKNNGNETIEELDIKHFIYTCSGICEIPEHTTRHIDGLGLAPGQSTEIDLGPYNFKIHRGQTISKFCVWATAPNGEIDIEPDGNWYCFEIDSITTSIQDLTSRLDIQISPNPTSDFISLQTEGDISRTVDIRIMNTSGQIVQERRAPLSQPIDVSSLTSGVYILTVISSERVQTVRQFVVSR